MAHFSFEGMPCKLACPKCKGNNLWVSEVWNGNGIYFHIQDGVMPGDAEDHFQGAAIALDVSCMSDDCRHKWRSRKYKNIHDTVDE